MADNADMESAPPIPPAELVIGTIKPGGSLDAITSPRPRKKGPGSSHRPATIDDITTVIRVLKGARVGVEADPRIVQTSIIAASIGSIVARAVATGIGTEIGPTANLTEGIRALCR
jgi:hypothetical protein